MIANANQAAQAKKRNEAAWRPVIVLILAAVVEFDDEQFKSHGPHFYDSLINLLLQDVTVEVRTLLHAFLCRIKQIYLPKGN